jgi:hypothetical protein
MAGLFEAPIETIDMAEGFVLCRLKLWKWPKVLQSTVRLEVI